MRAEFDKPAFLTLRAELAHEGGALLTGLVLLCDLSLLALAAWLALVASFVGASALATLLATLALLQLYLIHHECVHRAVFRRDRYNVLLGELLGFLLVYPFLARRRSHMLHHAWAGHLERDPTNARARARLSTLSPRQLSLLAFLWRAWFPFLALNERVGLFRSSFLRAEQPRQHARERLSAYLCLCGYLALAVASPFLPALRVLAASYLPALFLLAMCEELINLPHHIESPTVTHKLALWQQVAVTHSCARLPLWSRYLLLSFNLHTAHHLFPALPWYRLAQAERTLEQRGLVVHARGDELTTCARLRRAPFAEVFAPYLRRPDVHSAERKSA